MFRGARFLLFLGVLGALWAPAAYAAFPGNNGKIAVSRGSGIWTVNPDGTGATQLTLNPYHYDAPDPFDDFHGVDFAPAWSPDGTKISFARLVLVSVGECGGGGDRPPYYHVQLDVYEMNADGSELTAVTTTADRDEFDPAWSPDGRQLAVTRQAIEPDEFDAGCDVHFDQHIAVIDRDGVLVRRLPRGDHAAWAPDNTKLAYDDDNPQSTTNVIWTIEPDGSPAAEMLANDPPADDFNASWAPDGTRLAFERSHSPVPGGARRDIFIINRDGGAKLNITGGSANDSSNPAWSPDGTRIAFESGRDTYTMAVDGSGRQFVTAGWGPDWQPIQPGYSRPKGATPFRASLVPAYIACISSNRTHGPPLAFASCNPPQERSDVLTVGTPDANGAAANFTGSVRLETIAGNPATPADEADVSVSIGVTDVRCRTTNAACPGGPLSDYEGRLLAVPNALRITDRLNTPPGPAGGPGTGDGTLALPFDCAATASTAIGSTCSLSTTIDAVIPGAVTEGKRSIWEIGQVHVRDAGPNGTGFESPACPPSCGDGDETLFLREGLFVP